MAAVEEEEARATPASARHAAAAAAQRAAANLAAEQQEWVDGNVKAAAEHGGSTRRRLLVGDGKAERGAQSRRRWQARRRPHSLPQEGRKRGGRGGTGAVDAAYTARPLPSKTAARLRRPPPPPPPRPHCHLPALRGRCGAHLCAGAAAARGKGG